MNSSPESRRFTACVTRSLDTLRLECPEAYLRACGSLAGLRVALEVNGERIVLGISHERIALLPAGTPADISASTMRTTIDDLYQGRSTTEQAILSDAVLLKGSIDNLASFHDALLDYVRGAVRCPSFPALMAAYRSPPIR
jgi:hypothetical protein